jgi:protein-tyrosine phosphatase
MAEGAFRLAVKRAGLQVECDSAGIAPEREGEAPDWRAQMVAGRNGANISGQRSRRVTAKDFSRFTHILASDRHVLSALQAMAPKGATAHLALLLDVVRGREGKSLRDPYRGSVAGFFDSWCDIYMAMREVILLD